MVDAKNRLEDILGTFIGETSIPFGSYDRGALRNLKATGWRRVYSSDGGLAHRDGWLQERVPAPLLGGAYAFALSRLSDQNLEHTVLGIFRDISRPTYDDAARSQVRAAQTSKAFDAAALQSLLRGRDTWTVD